MAIPKTGNVSLKDAYANLYPTKYNVNGTPYRNWNMTNRDLKEITCSSGPMALTDLRGRAVSLHPNRATTFSASRSPGETEVEIVQGGIVTHGYITTPEWDDPNPIPSAYQDYYNSEIEGGYVDARSACNLNCSFYCDRSATFIVDVLARASVPRTEEASGWWGVAVGYQNGWASSNPSVVLHSEKLVAGFNETVFGNHVFEFTTNASYPHNMISLQLINLPNTSAGVNWRARVAELDVREK